jgi:hypothetical protein
MFCINAFGQDMYDIIATAYVTTTISQKVVFNSTMQQGGTFTFSALAHNGGGRAGQSDTANVKIQFYTSSNALVATVNSNYSANLPIPNAVCGNPCVDPNVPWTTLTTSTTLTAAQAATVAYATISMYGIDGSYWAGDYGPWYRAPTFTLNGGPNMVYNPEFGPYNGITAQGWTSSPGFGACQGAWGGSNACIVNSAGVPGTNTTGLVANQNGGGPSATGGTTSGQPGGYNSTMTTTNANGAPVRTVTSTTTTNQTQTIISGNRQIVITTPVTVTNYSDGTSTTSSGTATNTTVSSSAFTGVHFGASQVADTQWNVNACMNTSTCQIYSTLPGGTYETGSWTPINANQYITFIPNTGADSASNPWVMILVNSDGTYTVLGTGRIVVQGVDEFGNIYLFFTNDNYNGTLLSGNLGLSGQGVTFTGTQNPTVSDTNTLSSNMSTTPLAPGQTGGTPIPPRPPFDGTINQTNAPTTQVIGSGPTYTAPVDAVDKQTRVNTWNNSTQQYNNMLYVDQVGEHNNVTITQSGIKNKIDMTISGNGNNITSEQTGSNYMKMDVPGWGNAITTNQTNTVGSNYAETKIQGNGNTVNHTQNGNGNQVLFSKISGDINTVTTTQSGAGAHVADVTLTGNYNNAIIGQSGDIANKANINLTNAGGPATVDLQQSGGKSVTIIQSCANPAGCNTTIRQ